METFKQGKVTARIDERGIDLGNINVNLYTMDNSTTTLDIHIKKRDIFSEDKEFIQVNLNQTTFKPVLHLITEDGSIFTNEELEVVKAEEGHVRYNVSDYVTKHVGRVQAKLFLIDEDSSINDSSHVADFYFKVNDSGITKAIGKEIHVDMLDDIVERILLKDIERFRGPKGDKGDTGEQGPKGDKGADGINGEMGPQGPIGPMGIRGDTGPKGEQGLQGPKGERGPEGVPGKDADMTEVNNLKKDDYYNITYEKFVDDKTKSEYYVTTIPHEDEEGNIIKLKRGFANDNFSDGILETARSFSNKKNLSFVANASVFDMKTNVSLGVQINEGKIIQESPHSNNYTLGIKEDNTLTYYTSDIPAQKIIDDGCHIALTGFYPLIENGERSDYNLYNVTENVQENHARQVIGQKQNKDLVFITVQGKGIKGVGVTYNDLYDICLKNDIVTAYSLDGGGSAQTVVRGSLINLPLDNNGYEERKVSDFLYVDKKNNNSRNRSYNYDFGQITKRIADLTADSLKNANIPKITTITVDLNNIKENGIYWATRETLNSPGEITYSILHFQMGQGNAMQLAIPYHAKNYEILIRRTISGMNSWSEWRTNEYSTEWLSLELLNGWNNYGGNDTVAECKMQGGVVYIRGLISGGLKDSGTTLFTLPEGLRPSKREYISTISKGDSGNILTRIIIETSGTARLLEGSSDWLILNHNFAI